jgi:hypothetical protein
MVPRCGKLERLDTLRRVVLHAVDGAADLAGLHQVVVVWTPHLFTLL